jgi:hypothetical protein
MEATTPWGSGAHPPAPERGYPIPGSRPAGALPEFGFETRSRIQPRGMGSPDVQLRVAGLVACDVAPPRACMGNGYPQASRRLPA